MIKHNNNGDIMDLVIVIIKTIFFYFFILLIFRVMGKREIAKLSIQDLVVSILMAELCAIGIENYKDSLLLTIIPIFILLFFKISCSYLFLKFNKFRSFVDGKPSLLINRGIINYKEMMKQRYSLDDLLLELRNNSIKDLKDVEYAVLENSGKLNIFKYKFLDKNSINPFPLILDGIVQKDTLEYIDKNEDWLDDYLKHSNLNKEDIFYAFYKNKKVYVIKRNELLY